MNFSRLLTQKYKTSCYIDKVKKRLQKIGHIKVSTDLFKIYNHKCDIVMLGDSIFNNVSWSELITTQGIAKRTIKGATSLDLLKILNFVLNLSPNICIIMCGTNDAIQKVSTKKTTKNILYIIKEMASHNISTAVISTPITEFEELNIYINKINKKLIEICDEKNILFVDINKKISNNGFLNKSYTLDGIHLSSKGYVVLGQEVKKIISKLKKG